jgi:hypothetical protein
MPRARPGRAAPVPLPGVSGVTSGGGFTGGEALLGLGPGGGLVQRIWLDAMPQEVELVAHELLLTREVDGPAGAEEGTDAPDSVMARVSLARARVNLTPAALAEQPRAKPRSAWVKPPATASINTSRSPDRSLASAL